MTLEEALAEIERQRAVIVRLNARCDHLGMRLGEVIRERDAALQSQERLREAMDFIATHLSTDWPERCQSNVRAARRALNT
jgi:hypothetical protein